MSRKFWLAWALGAMVGYLAVLAFKAFDKSYPGDGIIIASGLAALIASKLER